MNICDMLRQLKQDSESSPRSQIVSAPKVDLLQQSFPNAPFSNPRTTVPREVNRVLHVSSLTARCRSLVHCVILLG